MSLPRGLPVVDHHCHLSPHGEGVAAARRFAAAGGTHLFLTTQNYAASVPTTLEDYRSQYETTDALARRIREEVGIGVYPVVAPYPIDLVNATPRIGVDEALELQRAALDLAGCWIRERRAVALGEVGRPHFPIDPAIGAAVDEAFRHAFAVARDADCPLVVHSADLDPRGYAELAALASAHGVPPERVVKHYARERIGPSDRSAVTPSYVARRELFRAVLNDDAPWFLETDFLDDPARPGAVLDLTTLPRRAASLAQGSPADAERLWIPFVESVERVYRWRPEVGGTP